MLTLSKIIYFHFLNGLSLVLDGKEERVSSSLDLLASRAHYGPRDPEFVAMSMHTV